MQTKIHPKELNSSYNKRVLASKKVQPHEFINIQNTPIPKRPMKYKNCPVFLITATLIQLSLLVYSIYLNHLNTGEFFMDIALNPLIGVSGGVLIQIGSMYSPCFNNQPSFQTPCVSGMTKTTNITFSKDKNQWMCSLKDVCGFNGYGLDNNIPNQWFRFITPIFLHGGIVHFLLNMILQMRTGFALERQWGSARMALIYMFSGVGGFIFSAIFIGTTPAVGASGSLYGLLACVLIDLIRNWKIIKKPIREFILTVVQIGLALLLGTLPAVDNFAHVGGFMFGILFGLLFAPNTWAKTSKASILWRGFLGILGVVIYAVLLNAFYTRLGASFCPSCKYLNCIPGFPWCESKWNAASSS